MLLLRLVIYTYIYIHLYEHIKDGTCHNTDVPNFHSVVNYTFHMHRLLALLYQKLKKADGSIKQNLLKVTK